MSEENVQQGGVEDNHQVEGDDKASSADLSPKGTPFTLPESFKNEKSLQSYKTVEDVLKSLVHSQRELGGSIRLPKEKDSDEARAEKLADIYAKLGRPEAADQYEVELKAFSDEEAEWDNDLVEGLKAVAFEQGLNAGQLQSILDFYAEHVGTSVPDIQKMNDEYKAELEEAMGPREFKRTAALSYAAAKELGGQDLIDYLAQTGQGNHPLLVKAFAKIGHILRENGEVDPAVVDSTLSVQEAQNEINKIMNDRDDIYHARHAGKPGHRERVEYVNELYRIIHA